MNVLTIASIFFTNRLISQCKALSHKLLTIGFAVSLLCATGYEEPNIF